MFNRKARVRAYWWKDVPNFGDAMAPLLLERFANIKATWAPICKAQVVTVGSILEHIPPFWEGYILGTGRLIEDSRLHLYKQTATVISLRGPLSARGVPGKFTFGDPGLLADELVGPQEKLYDLGILPHWQDKFLTQRFLNIIPKTATYKLINPGDDPLMVLRQIGSCHRIVTSSLHGMIAADAFGLPRRVEACAAMNRDGGLFKFRDYSRAIGTNFTTGLMMSPNRNRVEDVRFDVFNAYQSLGEILNA